MPDIQEAKYYEFTVQIFPSIGAPGGRGKKIALRTHIDPPRFISVYTLYTGLLSMDEALMTT